MKSDTRTQRPFRLVQLECVSDAPLPVRRPRRRKACLELYWRRLELALDVVIVLLLVALLAGVFFQRQVVENTPPVSTREVRP